MVKKVFFFLMVGVFVTVDILAQQTADKSYFEPHRITLGGNFGMNFGNDVTMINIAPQVGYFFTPQLNAGVGVSYTFYKYKNTGLDDLRYHYAGLNLFGRFYPIQYIILHVQPEINILSRKEGVESKTELVTALVAGAGLRYDRFHLMLEYDVVQNKYSPYGNKLFYSVGVSF